MIEIIPAIDLMDGKCVRLEQGNFTKKKVYFEDPLVVARQFRDAGLKRLHIVDLDGARKGHIVNQVTLERISSQIDMVIDFGGGIKDEKSLEMVFEAGAEMASIGSLAVKNPGLLMQWIKRFGPEKFLLGADVQERNIAIAGWQENSNINVFDFIGSYMDKGLNTIFCTDIAKDGLLSGPSVGLYKELLHHFPGLRLIASGGVSSVDDVKQLETIGCSGVIVGKAIYEGRISIHELSLFTTTGNWN